MGISSGTVTSIRGNDGTGHTFAKDGHRTFGAVECRSLFGFATRIPSNLFDKFELIMYIFYIQIVEY